MSVLMRFASRSCRQKFPTVLVRSLAVSHALPSGKVPVSALHHTQYQPVPCLREEHDSSQVTLPAPLEILPAATKRIKTDIQPNQR
ncbi:hypothetical protein NPIL_254431 [Nephila pilipes]|uniref:Uncharacterized protein n=1 Tax=Nephila pilipes TaxID=299642 RepID=A0A8X6MSD8_NEPPI|nr:hypothetical protein NPIL_254431 [Nephila pilipes]